MVSAGAVGRCQTRPSPSGFSPSVARPAADVRVTVRQVDVAERRNLLSGQRGREHRAAERGVEDTGPHEVGRPAQHDPQPSLGVGGEVAGVELRAHQALAGRRVPRGVLGHHRTVRLTVRIERVEHDEAGPHRLGRRRYGLLDPRHGLDLEVVAHVHAVVHDARAVDHGAGALRGGDVGGEPADAFECRSVARPVDEPDRVAVTGEFDGECGAGGARAENYLKITCCGHGCSARTRPLAAGSPSTRPTPPTPRHPPGRWPARCSRGRSCTDRWAWRRRGSSRGWGTAGDALLDAQIGMLADAFGLE